MAGQRRYGTTKGDKLTAVRGGSSKASKGPSAEQPRVTREARALGGEEAGRERPASEREPLLLGSSDSGNDGRNLGGSADVFAPGSSRRDNGKVLTTLLVLNYMIGSGILNSSQVFQGSGIGPATILYAVSGMTSSSLLLLKHDWGTAHVLLQRSLYPRPFCLAPLYCRDTKSAILPASRRRQLFIDAVTTGPTALQNG